MLPLTILLIGLGIYGGVASEKLYERWLFWRRRTEALEGRLDRLHPKLEILQVWQEVLACQEKAFPRLFRLRLHYLWMARHLGIALSVVVLTAIAVFAR